VNIGCGFDTTFERIDNGKITFYDLDLPDVINLRKQFISNCSRREQYLDIFEHKLVQSIGTERMFYL